VRALGVFHTNDKARIQ